MGISIKYSVGGRSVSQSQFFQNMEEEATKLAHNSILEHIQGVRCPIHGERARNIRESSDADSIGFTFEACCERLREEVGKSFK